MIDIKTLLFYFFFEIISIFFIFIYQIKEKKYIINNVNNYNNNNNAKKMILKKSTLFLWLSFFTTLILIGFRDISVGTDTQNYVETFNRISSGILIKPDIEWLSYGFIAIIKFLGSFTNNYVIYNLFIGFLTLLFLYKAITNLSDNPAFSLFVFFSTCLYYQMFNQSRQMLAIVIIMYSYKYIINKNFKKFLLISLLATSIHKSAIIIIPFYFLVNFRINLKNIFRYGIIALGTLISFPVIKKILLLTYYGVTYQRNGFFITTSSSVLNLIFRVLLIIICIYFISNYCDKNDRKNIVLTNFGLWCIIFQILATKIYIIARITTYFYIAFIMLIPNVYMQIKEKKPKKLFLYGMIIGLFLYHILYFKFVAVSSGYDIYKFF